LCLEGFVKTSFIKSSRPVVGVVLESSRPVVGVVLESSRSVVGVILDRKMKKYLSIKIF